MRKTLLYSYTVVCGALGVASAMMVYADKQSGLVLAADLAFWTVAGTGVILYAQKGPTSPALRGWIVPAWMLVAYAVADTTWLNDLEPFGKAADLFPDILLDLGAAFIALLIIAPALVMNLALGYPQVQEWGVWRSVRVSKVRMLFAVACMLLLAVALRAPEIVPYVLSWNNRPIAPYIGVYADTEAFRRLAVLVDFSWAGALSWAESRLGVRLTNPDLLMIRFEDDPESPDFDARTGLRHVRGHSRAVVSILLPEAFKRSEEETGKMLAHELAHAIFVSRLSARQHRDLPRWLREGLALYAADDVDARLDLLASGSLWADSPVEAICDGWKDVFTPEDYAEAAAAIEHLRTTVSEEAPRRLARDVLSGMAWEQSLAAITGGHAETFLGSAREACRARLSPYRAAESTLRAARRLVDRGNLTRALRLLSSDGDGFPQGGIQCSLLILKARILVRMAHFEDATAALDSLRSSPCFSSMAQWIGFATADAYLLAGDTADASEVYEALIARHITGAARLLGHLQALATRALRGSNWGQTSEKRLGPAE